MEIIKPNYIRLKDVISDISNYVSFLWNTLRGETKTLINSWTHYILNIEKYLKTFKEKYKLLKTSKQIDKRMIDFEQKVENFLWKFRDSCLSKKFKKPRLNVCVSSTILSTGNYPFLPKKLKMDFPLKPNYVDHWIFRLKPPANTVHFFIDDNGLHLQTHQYEAKFLDYSFNSPVRKLILAEFSFNQKGKQNSTEDKAILDQMNNLAMEDRKNLFEMEISSDIHSDSENLIFNRKSILEVSQASAPWPLSKEFETLILNKGRDIIVKIQEENPLDQTLIVFDSWVCSSIENEKQRKS